MNEQARLRWQCRRGTKELDLLLLDYLENRYPKADNDEKLRFCEMLKLDDPELQADPWFNNEFVMSKSLSKSD